MIISLIGRPNVGKSSLFNRLVRSQHKAITMNRPGVTRDRHYSLITFDDHGDLPAVESILVDTGGFYPQKVDENVDSERQQKLNVFFNIMASQSKIAIDESDLVLFVVDVREGMIPFDQSIVNYLRTVKKPFWVLANKYDTDKQEGDENDFYQLGIDQEQLYVVSSAHGLGIERLRRNLHELVWEHEKKKYAAQREEEIQKGVRPRSGVVASVAIIGAPNAGKSTLLNQIIGAERALVSPVAGTTVDPIEGYFELFFGPEANQVKARDNAFNSPFLHRKDRDTLVQEYHDYVEKTGGHFSDDEDETEMVEWNENPFAEIEEPIEEDIQDMFESEKAQTHQFDSNDSSRDKAREIDFLDHALFAESDENLVEPEATPEEAAGSYWHSVRLVDTAGIRRPKQVDGQIEAQSVYRALHCITEADVVLFMIDCTKGMTHQDRRLCDIALEKGKSLILCFNKVDLAKDIFKTIKDRKEWLADVRDQMPWLDFCDVVTLSAKYGEGMRKLKEVIAKTILVRHKVIGTGALNRAIAGLVDHHPIVIKNTNGQYFKVRYASVVKTNPPTVLMFSNRFKEIPEHYRKYLQNGLRREFKLRNTPVHLIFRSSSNLNKKARSLASR